MNAKDADVLKLSSNHHSIEDLLPIITSRSMEDRNESNQAESDCISPLRRSHVCLQRLSRM